MTLVIPRPCFCHTEARFLSYRGPEGRGYLIRRPPKRPFPWPALLFCLRRPPKAVFPWPAWDGGGDGDGECLPTGGMRAYGQMPEMGGQPARLTVATSPFRPAGAGRTSSDKLRHAAVRGTARCTRPLHTPLSVNSLQRTPRPFGKHSPVGVSTSEASFLSYRGPEGRGYLIRRPPKPAFPWPALLFCPRRPSKRPFPWPVLPICRCRPPKRPFPWPVLPICRCRPPKRPFPWPASFFVGACRGPASVIPRPGGARVSHVFFAGEVLEFWRGFAIFARTSRAYAR